jgi:hypothetical protein
MLPIFKYFFSYISGISQSQLIKSNVMLLLTIAKGSSYRSCLLNKADACIFSLLSSALFAVVHAPFSIELRPTRHFSYSSGSLSSMYFLILSLTFCLKYDMSLFTVVNLHKYNESLVRRGEIVLDSDVIDNWHHELNGMYQGTEGSCIQISRFICATSWIPLIC